MKSISISNPDQIMSVIISPYNGEGQIDASRLGGVMDLSTFANAVRIECRDNDITGFGVLPLYLQHLDCSTNKISELPSTFIVPPVLHHFNISNNDLDAEGFETIISAFYDTFGDQDLSELDIPPQINVSQNSEEFTSGVGGKKAALISNGWIIDTTFI